MSIEIRCDCCLRVGAPNIRGANKNLMGDWIDHICEDCFSIWYEEGQTDPAAIRAMILAAAERGDG